MGDFNYGGSYVGAMKDKFKIDTEKNLMRLIGHDVQTAVKSGHPYDRIYVSGEFKEAAEKGQVKASVDDSDLKLFSGVC